MNFMKPCSQNRKQITWLALGELDAADAKTLREHLSGCEGCRRYFDEMSGVTEKLAAAEPDTSVQAPDYFHQRLTEKLRATESGSVFEDVAAWIARMTPGWRVALPGMAVVLLAVFVVMSRRQPLEEAVVQPPAAQVVTTSGSVSDSAPTMGNYQMLAGQSLDKLDEALTREGNASLSPAPIYTGSMSKLPDTAF
jgi:anti-sigma factor RsiW